MCTSPDEIQIPDIKIWDATRATSATPAYFKPFYVGHYELLDGGLGANNPLGW
jgi:patatin-like phospholipase/acyl hydrolase